MTHNNQPNWPKNIQYIQAFSHLFEQDEAFIFIKDLDGKVIYSNQAMIEFYHNLGTDIMGKQSSDFLPHFLADIIDYADQHIIETGQPAYNITERLPHKTGGYRWYIKNKVPLYDDQNQLIGICGTSRRLTEFDQDNEHFTQIAPATDYMMDNFHTSISIPSVARKMGISARQLNRYFRKTFGSTPLEYLTHIRVLKACSLLKHTHKTLSAITGLCGFYDQSHFTHKFKKQTGTTPAKFRKEMQRP